ncbi:hypothetical protein MCUN1_001634 [Malassezia cuniculi]|uniref:Uncharacterized protein n=1 Tax=Malassezia cuniculi TaxID=948313 RepID=A0AAF0ET65_9BASI|nr:hypothetical protein MCUN1_001634 [Malassezia cuniculi]
MPHASVESTRARGPLVPLAVIDAPTQRFYAASVFIAIEVWKFTHLIQAWFGVRSYGWTSFSLFRALLVDFAVVYALHRLAIPVRAAPIKKNTGNTTQQGASTAAAPTQPVVSATQLAPERTLPFRVRDLVGLFVLLAALDVLLTSDTFLVLYGVSYASTAALQLGSKLGIRVPGGVSTQGWGLSERRLRVQDVVKPASHIRGQHTVHLRPYGTARLAPFEECVCLSGGYVEVPVIFNGTVPSVLHYSVTDPATGEDAVYEVHRPRTQPYTPHAVSRSTDEPDVPPRAQRLSLRERLQERAHKQGESHTDSQLLVHQLRVSHRGIVRLVSVADAQQAHARIEGAPFYIVPCPSASFASGKLDYCPGDDASVQVRVSGVPPLALNYFANGAEASIAPIVPRDARGGWTSHNTSLDLSLDVTRPGVHEFGLRSVRDACGNSVLLEESRHISVHARARAQFDEQQCSPDSPIKLVRGRQGIDLRVDLSQEDGGSDAWDVRVDYAPDMRASLAPRLGSADAWQRTLTMRAGARNSVHVDGPGTYTLAHVGGRCDGIVGAPWTCQVVDVPPPSAAITFESIEDPCAGTVGVKALSVLQGEPPFRLTYEVHQQGEPARRQVRIVRDQTRDELELWPSREGQVTYRFVSLSDANYDGIALEGPSFTAVVHPLAGAEFVDVNQDGVVTACGSSNARADIQFSGTGPWELTFAVRRGSHAAEHTVKGIASPRYTLDVPLPDDDSDRSAATISLLGLRDGKGCTRRLATRDLRVDVGRAHATVGFLPSDAGDRRSLTMLDGASVRLPMRLSGDGPWRVRYIYEGDGERDVRTAIIRDANAALTVTEPGKYTLIELEDAHCPGSVLEKQETYLIHMRARPQAVFAGTPHSNGSVVRAPVCAGTQDAAWLHLDGAAPISVSYVHTAPGKAAQRNTLRASQQEIPMELDTSPGRHVYDIAAVGDAVYPAESVSKTPALRLEQHIWPRAQATFERAARPTFCRGDALVGLPAVRLTGAPPFSLELALRRVSAPGKPQTFVRRDIMAHDYTVSAPEVVLDTSGTYELIIERVNDAHGCATHVPDTPLLFDVVETAGIVPASARRDYCVGEQIDFVLQGTSPWTVHYSFGGKHMRITARTPEFSRIAERPGVLVVHSAAHQLNQCRSERGPTESVIHALPSAHVSGGRHVVESLHQGDAAEIVFRLTGDPPFAFTYQRTEAVDTHSTPRVLETHTVEGITESTYTIRTSEEGTWSVVWIQDRWCQVSLGQMSGPASWASIV